MMPLSLAIKITLPSPRLYRGLFRFGPCSKVGLDRLRLAWLSIIRCRYVIHGACVGLANRFWKKASIVLHHLQALPSEGMHDR